jgi:hypothetical protein
LFAAALALAGAASANNRSYELDLSIEPAEQQLAVTAVIQLPAAQTARTLDFLLTGSLTISAAEPAVELLEESAADGFQGINGSSIDLARREGIKRYRLTVPPGATRLELSYAGSIDFPLETQGEEYTRGFRETPGIISEEGVYLAGSTLWYPYFDDQLISFSLSARAPDSWQLISQGDGNSQAADGVARWDSAGLVDEIYLVGGPLIRYEEATGAATAEVYLHEADPALAARYLEATARYIEMYRQLIGPYPYGKFALVENFWETGYGMPSFTLLGPQIIRFPFILTSSYPHEILHNWWGNSVFVDYDTGNWCEGLTAYMADHLIKEQQGQGAEYRRDTLKKYRDFVQSDRDFPLTEFRSRYSAATEAVGYGKTLMGFHMLRLQLGDEAFRAALQSFYRKQRGTKADFQDLRTAFEAASGQNLERFFREWVTLTGAADLSLADVSVKAMDGSYQVEGRLLQTQDSEPLELQVPIAVLTARGTTLETVSTQSESQRFTITTAEEPLQLSMDPAFDVFRRLDVRETAPSIGQIFGEDKIIAVVPASLDAATREAYAQLARSWASPAQTVEIMQDDDLAELPADQGVWLLGKENRLARQLFADDGVARVALQPDGLELGGQRLPFATNSTVVLTRNPRNASLAVGWISAASAEAMPGLARKLPHYGKYSYLAFTGDEPANTVKGEWVAVDSPFLVDLRPAAQQASSMSAAMSLPQRQALAELPPVFSRERMLQSVAWLAAPEREGRGLGTRGLAEAAAYIEAAYADIGLTPAGDSKDSYQQNFTVATGPKGGPNSLQNLVGYLPGTDPRFADQAIIISAHYDHLGYGWPDERAAAAAGALYPGADDNASGIAVLLELARAYASGPPPPRSLVFLALSGEEAGLLGSAHYVQNPRPVPLGGIRAVVNMDTVGRLGEQPVSILATESATEWPHIFRGVGFTTGIPTRTVPGASESSDQQSFINVGIPGVQIFTGAHLDYHRPGDTVDKVDGDGLVRVASVVRETTNYLLERAEPLTVTGAALTSPTRSDGNSQRRRVSFGTVPDFAWQGPGVKVESVVPGSPAALAGIGPGDVIMAIDGQSITDLGAFSAMLKKYAAGDRITAAGEREGEVFEVELELVAR